MSIWYVNTFDEEPEIRDWQFGEMAQAYACFLCHEPLSFPLVMWAGAGGSIYLHEDCAPRFVVKLSRDCHELSSHREHGCVDSEGALRNAS